VIIVHPFHEEGVSTFQQIVKKVLLRHLEKEQALGKDINAAEPERGEMDSEASKILSCLGSSKELVW
jgi:hypothetical protein